MCNHIFPFCFLAKLAKYKKMQYNIEPRKGEIKMQVNNNKEYKNFSKIVNTFYNEEIENISEEEIDIKSKGTIKLEPKIIYDKFTGNMKIEFQIGKNKMYKIKNLAEFYTKMMNKENFKYKEGLQFIHDKEMFTKESKPLLEFMLKYAEIMKYANSNSNSNYKYFGKALNENFIIIGNNGIDEIFDILKDQEVKFQKDGKEEKVKFIEENPKLEFLLKKTKNEDYIIIPNIDIYKVVLIRGKKYKYILEKNKLYRCNKNYEKTTIKMLETFRQNYITEVELGTKQLTQFFSIIMPKMENSIKILNIPEYELEQYKPKHLEVKVFLDFDNAQNIIADVKFKYGKDEFNPLDEKTKIEFPRNIIEETKALNIFRKTGFMFEVKNLRFILQNNDKIYVLYRSNYKTQFNKMNRNKNNITNIKDKFDKWNKLAKVKAQECRNGIISFDDLKIWFKTNQDWHKK